MQLLCCCQLLSFEKENKPKPLHFYFTKVNMNVALSASHSFSQLVEEKILLYGTHNAFLYK